MASEKLEITTIETIILRFRDLVTGHGGTVEQHNAICKTNGSVWWAWWNKPDEQVPVTAFTNLVTKIHAKKKLKIFLLDSGQNKIYTADCKGIKWDGRQRITSPNPDLTPEYYRANKYLAWFELEQIKEYKPSLDTYSYVHVDEFFSDSNVHTGYKEFSKKIISSPEELQQQNRTVWFIRPATPSDSRYRIQLLDANRTTPSDFPLNVQVSPGHKLLWMSDLHFSVDGFHGFPSVAKPQENDLWSAIKSCIPDFKDYAGALASGDLTWKAAPEEYDQFKEFAGNIIRDVCRSNSHFLTICPGNHDLSFENEAEEKDAAVKYSTQKARNNYEDAYRAIHYLKPNEHLCCGRRYVLNNGIPVEIISLNSSTLQQYKDRFQGQGFIGQKQLDYAAAQLNWDEEPDNGAFRILMLHHHLIPVTYNEKADVDRRSSVVYDANAVLNWASKAKVKLILHGHQHEPFCAKLSLPPHDSEKNRSITKWHDMHIVGLGSTGVKTSHLGETGINSIGVLSFEISTVKISVYALTPQKSELMEIWSIEIPR